MATLRLWFDPKNKIWSRRNGAVDGLHIRICSSGVKDAVYIPIRKQYGHPYHQLNTEDAPLLPEEVLSHIVRVTLEDVIAGPLANLLPQGKWNVGPVTWEVKGEPTPTGWAARIYIEAPSILTAMARLRCILGRQGHEEPEVLYYQPPTPALAGEKTVSPGSDTTAILSVRKTGS